ncbi:MAG: hypothetical protein GY828_08495 [Candidatus Gracilibacteria bacterium]|nr:hypothetical protein [Candidatus Gracilibacteria bacterium]
MKVVVTLLSLITMILVGYIILFKNDISINHYYNIVVNREQTKEKEIPEFTQGALQCPPPTVHIREKPCDIVPENEEDILSQPKIGTELEGETEYDPESYDRDDTSDSGYIPTQEELKSGLYRSTEVNVGLKINKGE